VTKHQIKHGNDCIEKGSWIWRFERTGTKTKMARKEDEIKDFELGK